MSVIRHISPMREASATKRTYPKRRPEKVARLNMEVFAGEDEIIRQAKHQALDNAQPLRDWVFAAIREKLERESKKK